MLMKVASKSYFVLFSNTGSETTIMFPQFKSFSILLSGFGYNF